MRIEAEFLKKGDVSKEVYDGLVRVVSFVKDKFPNSVSGIWIVKQNLYGQEAQIIVQTSLVRGTMDYIVLDGTISRLLGGSIMFNYDELDSDTYGIKEEIEKGNVAIVYRKGEAESC